MIPAPAAEAISVKYLVVRLHSWIRQHRWQCFLCTALCWVGMACIASRMQTDTSSMAFFPDDAPEIRQMAEALDISPASRLVFVTLSTQRPGETYALAQSADAVVQALSPDLAERAGMSAMPDPGALLTLLPFLTDEAALACFLSASGDAQVDAAIHAARNNLGSLFSAAIQQWQQSDPLGFRRIILSRLPAPGMDIMPDPLLGYPISPTKDHLLLILRPTHSLHDVRAATQLMDALQEALRTRLQPGMQSLVVGGHRHSAANTRTIEQDVANIAVFSVAGLALIYLLLVRSKGALWLLLVPCAAISAGLGGMALLAPALSGLALGFGASVLGIADDYAVHMHFALRSGRNSADVLETMALPLAQGYMINATGFAVLLLSAIPALRQLAGFALLAISAGFALALTLIPICPWIAEPTLRSSSRQSSAPRQPVAWRTLGSAVILFSLCCIFFTNVRIDVSPRTMGADMAQMQEDAARLRAIWGLRDKEMLVVQAQDEETALDQARTVVSILRQNEPDNVITTISDIWPTPAQQRENLERWNAFVREQGAGLKLRIRESARKYGFTEEAFAAFEHMLAPQNAALTPAVFRAAGLGEVLDNFLHQAPGHGKASVLLFTRNKADISKLPAAVRARVTALSPGTLETALLQALQQEKRLVPLAWFACFSLLFIYFRDIRRTLLASLPPLCSITCILAWMACTDTPMTLAAMAALPLVLGLAADHGIMVTHDLAHGRNMGVDRAVLVASLTALTSMGFLAFARHPALHAMGEIIFWGLLIEVPAALWLLPRLCRADAATPCHGSTV